MASVGAWAQQLGTWVARLCLRYPALVVTPIALAGLGLWATSQGPRAPLSQSHPYPSPLPSDNRSASPSNLPPIATATPASPLSGPASPSPLAHAATPPASATPPATSTVTPIAKPTVIPTAKAIATQPPTPAALRPSGVAPLAFDPMVTMKVLIAGKVSSLELSSSAGGTVSDAQGNALTHLREGGYIQTNGSQLNWNGQALPPLIFVDPNPGGLLYLNGKPYRGRLLLTSADGTLWAINYIDLQQYLYSVVGSEVSPSWPIAALKAQTVAARSYALYYQLNPANPLFHIGSDEYYQVYSGARTEAPEIIRAVRETLGEYISHKGGIVESLYAASDDIVSEAFGGQGMSQLGARDFAQQGYNYTQILNHYYPGTKVGRIVVGMGD